MSVVVPLAPPLAPSKEPEREKGWHGIEPLTIEVDGQLVAELGGATKVGIARSSPAWNAGLRTCDYVLSASPSPVTDMTLEEFNSLGLPAGAEFFVKFHRPGRSKLRNLMTTVIQLRARPKPKMPPRCKRMPRVAFGDELERRDRARFESEMSAHPLMTPLGFRILVRLLRYYQGKLGICPSYRTLARDVKCTRRTVIRQLAQLSWLGIVKAEVGGGPWRLGGPANAYTVHWPNGWRQTVVKIKAPR